MDGQNQNPFLGPSPQLPQPSSIGRLPVIRHPRFILLGIVVFLLFLVGGGVYFWQHGEVNNLTKVASSQKAEIATLQKQVSDLEASFKTGPANKITGTYAGWKTFCDNLNSACFNYPKDWVITGTSSTQKTTEDISSPNSKALVQYENPFAKDKLDHVYYIADIQDLQTENSKLKIVGRVVGNTPDYVVIDTSYVTTNNVVVGKSISFVDTARFTDNTGKNTVSFKAAPSGAVQTTIKSTDQATAWFKSDEAKASLLILQSLYYQ